MPPSGGRSSFPRAADDCGIAPRSPVTEWIRVWAHEMRGYERAGWRFSHARVGGPSEQLFGSGYPVRQLTDWMMREVAHG
jgi:hypothetical protein